MLEVLLLDELELPHAVKVTVSASPKIVKLTALSHFFISITPVELYFLTKKVVLYQKRTTADRGTTLVSKRVHNAWLNELIHSVR